MKPIFAISIVLLGLGWSAASAQTGRPVPVPPQGYVRPAIVQGQPRPVYQQLPQGVALPPRGYVVPGTGTVTRPTDQRGRPLIYAPQGVAQRPQPTPIMRPQPIQRRPMPSPPPQARSLPTGPMTDAIARPRSAPSEPTVKKSTASTRTTSTSAPKSTKSATSKTAPTTSQKSASSGTKASTNSKSTASTKAPTKTSPSKTTTVAKSSKSTPPTSSSSATKNIPSKPTSAPSIAKTASKAESTPVKPKIAGPVAINEEAENLPTLAELSTPKTAPVPVVEKPALAELSAMINGSLATTPDRSPAEVAAPLERENLTAIEAEAGPDRTGESLEAAPIVVTNADDLPEQLRGSASMMPLALPYSTAIPNAPADATVTPIPGEPPPPAVATAPTLPLTDLPEQADVPATAALQFGNALEEHQRRSATAPQEPAPEPEPTMSVTVQPSNTDILKATKLLHRPKNQEPDQTTPVSPKAEETPDRSANPPTQSNVQPETQEEFAESPLLSGEASRLTLTPPAEGIRKAAYVPKATIVEESPTPMPSPAPAPDVQPEISGDFVPGGKTEEVPAATPPSPVNPSLGAVTIDADRADHFSEDNKVKFDGNVKINCKRFLLTANKVTAEMNSADHGGLKHVHAIGKVIVRMTGASGKSYVASSHEGFFDPIKETMRLTGWPKIEQGGHALVANSVETEIVIDTKTGQLKTTGSTRTVLGH